MTSQMEQVVKALIGIAKRHGKNYCYVAQNSLQELLVKHQDWNRSERTVRRMLKDLDDRGYIKVVHRNWSEVNGVKKFRCNLYLFTKKLFIWLSRVGEYARKVFSFFRRPKLADYSSLKVRRDLVGIPPDVEILWKSPIKGRASPLLGP